MADEKIDVAVKTDPVAMTGRFSAGLVIDERYRIEALVAVGGMCTIYRAEHVLLKKTVAVKVLQQRLVRDNDALARFNREARLVAELQHPNIVNVYGFGSCEGLPYMAIEWLDGMNLAQLLKQDGRLSPEVAVPIFVDILNGLEHAHNHNILHRDIKPSNVMLVGEQKQAKLVDFGIAKILPENGRDLQKLTMTGEIFGTLFYMSPEQCMAEKLDPRSDLYSMGCLMYETLTGELPIKGSNSMSIVAKQIGSMPEESQYLRGDLEKIVLWCLRKKADERPQSAQELKAALLNPSKAKPPRAKSGKGHLRHKFLVVGIAAMIFTLLGTGWMWWHHKSAQRAAISTSVDGQGSPELKALMYKANVGLNLLTGEYDELLPTSNLEIFTKARDLSIKEGLDDQRFSAEIGMAICYRRLKRIPESNHILLGILLAIPRDGPFNNHYSDALETIGTNERNARRRAFWRREWRAYLEPVKDRMPAKYAKALGRLAEVGVDNPLALHEEILKLESQLEDADLITSSDFAYRNYAAKTIRTRDPILYAQYRQQYLHYLQLLATRNVVRYLHHPHEQTHNQAKALYAKEMQAGSYAR